ncbi:unnamed protein product [Brassica rapa]|uniref:Uncharacterized protein n=2 Tax=Brassica TaxID=3705 RepID=A0A8D9LUY7_BRACM|nr:unnamed protein product [Brassica napus]CAG7887828.1 unnamed protein product [Brassica rapa]
MRVLKPVCEEDAAEENVRLTRSESLSRLMASESSRRGHRRSRRLMESESSLMELNAFYFDYVFRLPGYQVGPLVEEIRCVLNAYKILHLSEENESRVIVVDEAKASKDDS